MTAYHSRIGCRTAVITWCVNPSIAREPTGRRPRDLPETLRWRHNGRDSISNHQSHYCLLNRLFRRRSKKTSKLPVTGLCVGNLPGTGEFPAQMASNAENVSTWWRHHDMFVWWLWRDMYGMIYIVVSAESPLWLQISWRQDMCIHHYDQDCLAHICHRRPKLMALINQHKGGACAT